MISSAPLKYFCFSKRFVLLVSVLVPYSVSASSLDFWGVSFPPHLLCEAELAAGEYSVAVGPSSWAPYWPQSRLVFQALVTHQKEAPLFLDPHVQEPHISLTQLQGQREPSVLKT